MHLAAIGTRSRAWYRTSVNTFIERWHAIRKERQTTVVAGLDPAVSGMGRGEKGLPEGADKLEWSLAFIEAVAPYVAALKPNAGYFGDAGERTVLKQCIEKAHELGLLVIADGKIAEIGATTDAWAYDYARLGADAVTLAPYAGNIAEAIQMAHARGMGAITMGLMSNPEYRREMDFRHPETGESLWEFRTRTALEAGADGIVVGGTYAPEDPALQRFLTLTKESEALYLVPGIGHQGGDVSQFFASGISPERAMISSSRELLFPAGSDSTPAQQAEAARALRDSIVTYA